MSFGTWSDKPLQSDPERMQQLFLSLQEEVEEKENLQTLNDFPDNSSAVG